ncbi:hypothetical protein phiOC_p378 [Ochrobactrum phage vB_OspM_OC]|nr:hypothetical protein phiOC_p378 [Ochrobactrum phage vB_OspM_OC]
MNIVIRQVRGIDDCNFQSQTETIITSTENRDKVFNEYFIQGDRDIEDYTESVVSECRIEPTLFIRTY